MLTVAPRSWRVDRFRYWLETNPRRRPYSARSVQAYVDQVNLFARWCFEQGLNPEKLTADDILDHLADMSGAGYASASITLRHVALRVYYEFVGRKPNPAKQIPVRQVQNQHGAPYSPREVVKLYAACKSYQERAIFLFMLGTGARKSETWQVTKDDINFDACTVRILGKGGQYRFVYLEPFVMDALEKHFEFADRLVTQRPNYLFRLMRSLGERAAIPGRHHPHRLRHTFATRWCEEGGQESELQLILGHTNPTMTQMYSREGRRQRALRTQSQLSIAARLLGPYGAAGRHEATG